VAFVIVVALSALLGLALSPLVWRLFLWAANDAPDLATSAGAGHGPQGKITLDEARNFRDFELFWPGERFQGDTVTAAYRFKTERDPRLPIPVGKDYVALTYGTCEPRPGPEASCQVPLAVHIEPYCMLPPDLIAEGAKQGPPFQLRGAQAQWVGEHLRIWTGGVSIAVLGLTPEISLEAANSLVSLNSGAVPSARAVRSASDPLPPPADITCPPLPTP